MDHTVILAPGERMKYSRSKRTAFRRLGDQTVVIDLQGRVVYGLNESAGVIWDAVARPGDAAEVAEVFESAEEATRVEQAVARFLETLRSLGLVRPAENVPPPSSRPDHHTTPFAQPEVLWHEPLTSFAQSCAMYGGSGEPCDSSPVR